MRRSGWVLCALVAVVAASGCLRKVKRVRGGDAEAELELARQVLPGCSPDPTSTADELILYCPDQAVFFAVKETRERSADKVFSGWLDELNARAHGELEVLERSEAKLFGPQYTALYVRMRTPQMPPEGFVEGYVAVIEIDGRRRRVWCSATGSEPTGLQRCEQDLSSMALLEVPRG